jgi:hypothetical protein
MLDDRTGTLASVLDSFPSEPVASASTLPSTSKTPDISESAGSKPYVVACVDGHDNDMSMAIEREVDSAAHKLRADCVHPSVHQVL